jgi:hypothetical protein
MPHYGSLTFTDRTWEKSRSTFNTYATTVVSLPDLLIDWGALKTAIDAISLCEMASERLVMDETVLSTARPTAGYAVRELKLRIDYSGDVSGKKYSVTIPGPDINNLTYLGETDFIDIADGGIMAAFVTAFETFVRTPDDDTETVTVLAAEVVGRNL